MISAAGIPVIDGDMDALAGHARSIADAGTGIAATGERVHATWQGLAAVYRAPEAGQLLAATAPVQAVSATVGEDLQAASQALLGYAEEVRAIQARLDGLRVQARELEGSVAGAEGTEEPGVVGRSDELVRQVNQAVADFDEAQRRCANAITALSGGPQYRADDGDGVAQPGEFGTTAAQLDTAAAGEQGVAWGRFAPVEEDGGGGGLLSDIGHTVLDVAGLVPVVGEVFDGINAGWYAAEGDYLNAGLSAAAMVPFAGWVATGGKFTIKAVHTLDGAKSWITKRPTMVPPYAEKVAFSPSAKFPVGQRYKWNDPVTGKRVQYHAHGTDPDRLPTENAGSGPIYRMKVGNHYLDAKGNRHTENSMKQDSAAFNPQAANDTHIPYPSDQLWPDRRHVRFVAPNPAGFLGPDDQEN